MTWAIDATTDVTTHHIEGVAIHGNTPFDMPLISHIIGNLWVGGCIDEAVLPDDFRHVISLYKWERYQIGADTQRAEVEMYDAAEIPPAPQLYQLAGLVLGCLTEGKTLVHCQAGLNRSNLIAGLALVLDGTPPEYAVRLLRERRSPAALCNPVFEGWLLSRITVVGA